MSTAYTANDVRCSCWCTCCHWPSSRVFDDTSRSCIQTRWTLATSWRTLHQLRRSSR